MSARRGRLLTLVGVLAVVVILIQASCSTVERAVGPAATPGSAGSARDLTTILLLGIDQRPDEAANHLPSRTDTMILVLIDATARRAALISIPRDLVVPIPGHGNQKINTAHFWGETDHPGSGPALAVQTIESNFGVRVDYFARVDFTAFEQGVDAVGGIVVDVQRPILDDAYPTESYGIKRVYFPGGPQWMNGSRALEYVRSRHSDNDFGRQVRQRQVILALEGRILRPQMALKLPTLISLANQSVGTDVALSKLPWLLFVAATIPPTSIVNTGITYDMVVDVNKDGSEFLPDRAKIQRLFATALDVPGSTPVANGSPTPAANATPNPIQVEVLNGTTRNELAALTADTLKTQGYTIARVAQADSSDYLHTLVTDRSGPRRAGPALAKAVGVPAAVVETATPRVGSADVTIVLGYDAPDPQGG